MNPNDTDNAVTECTHRCIVVNGTLILTVAGCPVHDRE